MYSSHTGRRGQSYLARLRPPIRTPPIVAPPFLVACHAKAPPRRGSSQEPLDVSSVLARSRVKGPVGPGWQEGHVSGILHQTVHRSEDKTCISPVWRSKKNQSRINRSRAASQVHINAPFRKLNVRQLGTRILLPPALLSKQQDSPQLPQWIVNPFRTTQAHQTRSVLFT